MKKIKKVGVYLYADCQNGVMSKYDIVEDDEISIFYDEDVFLDSLKDLKDNEKICTFIQSEKIYDAIDKKYGIK